MSYSCIDRCKEIRWVDDMSYDESQLGLNKKRLNMEQVKVLEKSFELGNKLETERKTQLARALGLKPRQIAIWFQNRRARWKTKQLEKDYDLMKKQVEALKSDNDTLKSQNKKLKAELLVLKSKTRESTAVGPINLNKETENSWSNRSDKICAVKMGTIQTPSADSPLYSHPSNKHVFSSSMSIGTSPTSLVQVLQGTSQQPVLAVCLKNDQTVPDQGFFNMFNSIDDQTTSF